MGRLKTKIKQLWKSYCAPFDERLSRCKETDKNNLFLCNYFLFILPGLIVYFTYNMIDLANHTFSFLDFSAPLRMDKLAIATGFPLFYLPYIGLCIWQLLELRRFSQRFFKSFFALVGYDGILMVFCFILGKDPAFLKQYALHLLVFGNIFYYFRSRKTLFATAKSSGGPQATPPL